MIKSSRATASTKPVATAAIPFAAPSMAQSQHSQPVGSALPHPTPPSSSSSSSAVFAVPQPPAQRTAATASVRSSAASSTPSSTSSSLRSARGVQPPGSPSSSSSLLAAGKKSPVPVRAKRAAILVDGSAGSGSKSMKKHFLSKSNDSLSGGGAAVLKKSRSHVATPQSTRGGIRHPAAAGNNHSRKDRSSSITSSTALVVPPTTLVLDGESSSPTATISQQQEMRRSVSSNCLDAPAASSDTTSRRLSIPNVNQLNDAMLLTSSSSSMSSPSPSSSLPSNFTPSRSGITLCSAGTQTDTTNQTDALSSSRRRSTTDLTGGDREFLTLLEEHSTMSRQLSELCKVEGILVPGEGGDQGQQPSAMDTSDGNGLSRSSMPSASNDWDAQSNNSLCSEPSLAGLQDRIQQMEETHHSTHEELQATLQELAEMSDIVIVYKKENEDLHHEKSVLQEALLSLTEKVQVYQTQADSLKKILYRQVAGDENSLPEDNSTGASSENEKTLVELMKCLQEEKEDSQHQLDSALEQNAKLTADLEDAYAKLHQLDSFCDQVESQKRDLESHVSTAKDSIRRLETENGRYLTQLESEKSKVAQLEETVSVHSKTTGANKADLNDLLDHVRREKKRLEEQLANADNRHRVLESDLEGLRAALKASEERKVAAEKSCLNNAQEFARRLEDKEAECRTLEGEINRLKKEIAEMESRNQGNETEKLDILHRYDNLRAEYALEQRDWAHFRTDLLTAVRVANEFRTECELKTKATTEENQLLKRKADDLTDELERLKTAAARKTVAATPPKTVLPFGSATASIATTAAAPGSAEPETRPRLSSVAAEAAGHLLLRSPSEREPLAARTSRTTPNQVSVKSIIQNLESNGRQTGRALAAVGKITGIRRRDENIVRSESNSSLDSTLDRTATLLDLDRYMTMDDEPSMPGSGGGGEGGLKPILSVKQHQRHGSLTGGAITTTALATIEGATSSGAVAGKGSLHESLGSLAKGKGSKRNALLKFCQEKTLGYSVCDEKK